MIDTGKSSAKLIFPNQDSGEEIQLGLFEYGDFVASPMYIEVSTWENPGRYVKGLSNIGKDLPDVITWAGNEPKPSELEMKHGEWQLTALNHHSNRVVVAEVVDKETDFEFRFMDGSLVNLCGTIRQRFSNDKYIHLTAECIMKGFVGTCPIPEQQNENNNNTKKSCEQQE